eukprot:CAMPEP_0174378944 /NCGR_PEP_ID=MMETSP0811_2-20130205/122381_1 /TAXON_ID=73025 ORGANISM="Eutreptiella gymnastica-like, Strain CCMP1594" /NCGR_SAMPLE_ID=MMETSP0811_2 /ASSEMBLY_ACC=CAM_ASM_000667 /LENGTH=125 /DNA_ID=CAMNT_0015531315 /DNA_START=2639 /DNA_END=3017 /DNA_ORIENTATION=+
MSPGLLYPLGTATAAALEPCTVSILADSAAYRPAPCRTGLYVVQESVTEMRLRRSVGECACSPSGDLESTMARASPVSEPPISIAHASIACAGPGTPTSARRAAAATGFSASPVPMRASSCFHAI